MRKIACFWRECCCGQTGVTLLCFSELLLLVRAAVHAEEGDSTEHGVLINLGFLSQLKWAFVFAAIWLVTIELSVKLAKPLVLNGKWWPSAIIVQRKTLQNFGFSHFAV